MNLLSKEEVNQEEMVGTLAQSTDTLIQPLQSLATSSSLSYLTTITTMTILGEQLQTCNHKINNAAELAVRPLNNNNIERSSMVMEAEEGP